MKSYVNLRYFVNTLPHDVTQQWRPANKSLRVTFVGAHWLICLEMIVSIKFKFIENPQFTPMSLCPAHGLLPVCVNQHNTFSL